MSDKFKALVHLIIASVDDPHKLGATKLNKICWFVDTLAFRLQGQPVTNERYVKRARGPVPKKILSVVRELELEKKIKVRHSDHPIYQTRLFINLEDTDNAVFSPMERSIIDVVVGYVCDKHTASSISDLTHDRVWEAANEGEALPLYASLAGEAGEITEEVTAWADSVLSTGENRIPVSA